MKGEHGTFVVDLSVAPHVVQYALFDGGPRQTIFVVVCLADHASALVPRAALCLDLGLFDPALVEHGNAVSGIEDAATRGTAGATPRLPYVDPLENT